MELKWKSPIRKCFEISSRAKSEMKRKWFSLRLWIRFVSILSLELCPIVSFPSESISEKTFYQFSSVSSRSPFHLAIHLKRCSNINFNLDVVFEFIFFPIFASMRQFSFPLWTKVIKIWTVKGNTNVASIFKSKNRAHVMPVFARWWFPVNKTESKKHDEMNFLNWNRDEMD